MNVIIFGTGACYKKYKSLVFNKDNVVALVDNSIAKQRTVIDGVPVIAPEKLPDMEFDTIVLLLAYSTAVQVREQLFQLGIPADKILFYDEYIANTCAGAYTVYTPKTHLNIAVVTTGIGYVGGIIAVINAARAILRLGNTVTLITPAADMKLVEELNDFGIKVVVYPAFCNMGRKELEWIVHFDFAVVNVFQQIDCAVKISEIMPMLWWIHENSENYDHIYSTVLARWSNYLNDNRIRQLPVFAVSPIAKRAFKNYFPNVPVKILPYCVGYENEKSCSSANRIVAKKQIITFALIAAFCERKQQKLFLDVAKMLNQKHFERLRFLLVGKAEDNAYSREVLELASQIQNVELTGVLTRSQMTDLYKNEIDIVVCPSLEETMSLTITEGMMHGKVCISSDNTGMAEYITDGKNGFICKAGDRSTLYEKMLYVAEHFDALDDMRRAARKTYEENFTMETFANRLDGIIKDIMRDRYITGNKLDAKI